MRRTLIIGGTRNLGPSIVEALLARGDSVTVLNRGITSIDLPRSVERLVADRSDAGQLHAAVRGRDFDLVVDTTLYNGPDAEAAIEILSGHVGHYVFLSTGQVYLVRVGLERPFKEEDYTGPTIPEPPREDEYEHGNWQYGFDKRQAENAFARGWSERMFPFTSLRLPIVNSERDHYDRVYGYFLRLQDGGPVLIPDDPGLPLRHVYGYDVVEAILKTSEHSQAKGRAYNIGQDDTLSLFDFLELLAGACGVAAQIIRVPRENLEREGLLTDCSPFSGRWMSALDNTRSKAELGMSYRSFHDYLQPLVAHFKACKQRAIPGYRQRPVELTFATQGA
ncbi:MAG TPA: NAD-dependent epimerase/dehydratase family protein [Candidatus Angelobacter sp.]|jgi:nucleoside-diphosphate-sugar epimerase|nr:NAD-dependent epimerase/dehydratase family protein [Candidatus Angelobacter sp.]